MFQLRSAAARHLVQMIAGVLVLDVAAVVVYSLAHLATASAATRTGFTVVWTLATLVVVGIGLRRLRKARYAQRVPGSR